jgi:thioredoxin reductase (NADPH)
LIGCPDRILDLLIVGAGPTGIAIGAEARQAGLEVLLVDRGPLLANLLEFPTFMTFFTTRDLLEIAGVPFAIPQDKPDRRQAIAYYQSIVRQFDLAVASEQEVVAVDREEDGVLLATVKTKESGEMTHRSRAVALATGYFHRPRRLGVAGEDLPWVRSKYIEPYPHHGQRIVVVGGGNSAAETALDLWRNGAHVTLVHRGETIKKSIKYWLRPDFEHRVEEGSIAAKYESHVTRFSASGVEIDGAEGPEVLEADAAYVLIGYTPDAEFERRCGIEIDETTLVPDFDEETCETNVSGLYVAGTLQAGRRTDKIFIENSRDHGRRIVEHLKRVLVGDAVDLQSV